LLLRMLVANAIGTFCLAVQAGDLSNYSVISLGRYHEDASAGLFVNRIEELPLYVLVGIVGGVMGGYFCRNFIWLRAHITGRFPKRGEGRAKWQLLEIALVSLVTSFLLYYLPSQRWACKPNSDPAPLDYKDGELEFHTESRARFFCPEGQINELADMLFGSRIGAIKRILTDPAQFKLETLLSVGILFYFLMTITMGLAIPSGIFTPTVLIGASLGGAAGILFQTHVDPEITPSTFALLGVAALLAGIQRSTVSVAVILVEGTGQIKVLTPAIIVVVIARYVAGFIHPDGIFEAVMKTKNVPYLDHEEVHPRYDAIEVGVILADHPLEVVSTHMEAQELVDLLLRSPHNGFPVVDPTTTKFLGLVRRDQIAALLECGAMHKSIDDCSSSAPNGPKDGLEKTPGMGWACHMNDERYDYIHEPTTKMKPPLRSDTIAPKKLSSLSTEFASVAAKEDGTLFVAWLNADYSNYWVDIGAVMNRGTFCVPEFCPVSKAYSLFTMLGLRHLIVLGGDSGGEVVGVLARVDLVPSNIKERLACKRVENGH